MRRRQLLCAAAFGLALGCGRSELAIPGGAGDRVDAGGTEPLADDGSVGSVDAGGADVATQSPDDDAAQVFFSPESGSGDDTSDGGCGPDSCQGCCLDDICESGMLSGACGTGGQRCVICGPELVCSMGSCG